MAVARLGGINGIKKILVMLNTNADDLLINMEWDNASVRIASIYREAEKTIPVIEADDYNMWNLAEHLTAYLVIKRLSHTLEGKMASDKDIKDATDQVWFHLGINPGDPKDSSDPVAIVGPRITNVGSSDD